MCGIGGFFSTHGLADGARLERMCAGLRHRGPDGDGTWRDPRGTAGLVHARLAIIDLSDGGAQPMRTGDGRYVIVFNGEIYNFHSLRRELEAGGHGFATESDTEVLLALVATEGARGLRRLRGMFALALWDTHEQRGLLARDGLGIKPLYHARTPDGIVFASELRSILATRAVPFRVDAQALEAFFATGSVPEPASLVEGIEVLPPGHILHWGAGGTRLEAFWTVEFPAPLVSDGGDAIRLTRRALEESIAAHFVSDVPVGLFLSGGIDSNALLALAARAGHARGMDTFSISVDAADFDEAQVAAASARHFGSRHHVLRMDAASAAASLDAFLDSMDVPSVDGFNTWTVSRLARSHGMKVVLSGLGGDELFGGYPSFRAVPALHRWSRIAGRAPWVAAAAGRLLVDHGRSSKLRRLGGLLQGPGRFEDAYRAYRGIFSAPEARLLVAHFLGGSPATPPADPLDAASARFVDPSDRVSYLEITRYMRNQLLRDSDVMSMAHGLELRLPLVDQALFDTVSSIAPAVRLQPGKQLLKDAVAEVPDVVRNAPKRGFRFPFRAWFQGPLNDRMGGSRRALPVRSSEWYQQWAILVFRHWFEARRRDAGG